MLCPVLVSYIMHEWWGVWPYAPTRGVISNMSSLYMWVHTTKKCTVDKTVHF
jgi:hypothetical protein